MMLSLRATLSALTLLSLISASFPTEYNPCSYDDSYKTTHEERKFYASITRKVLMKCSQVIVRQVLEIPSSPRRIFESSFPKACFMYKVCMTLQSKSNATGRNRYQMSMEDTEKVVECLIRFSKLIDKTLLAGMFGLTEKEAMQFDPATLMIEILGCFLRHVGPGPAQLDPALRIAFQVYAKLTKLLD